MPLFKQMRSNSTLTGLRLVASRSIYAAGSELVQVPRFA